MKKSFKAVFQIITGLFIVIVSVVCIVLIWNINAIIKATNDEYHETILTNIVNELSYEINEVTKMTDIFAGNPVVQQYVDLWNKSGHEGNSLTVKNEIFPFINYVQGDMYVVIRNKDNQSSEIISTTDSNSVSLFDKTCISNQEQYIGAEGDYIIVSQTNDIKIYDLVKPGYYSIGKISVVKKINRYIFKHKINFTDDTSVCIVNDDSGERLELYTMGNSDGPRNSKAMKIENTNYTVNCDMLSKHESKSFSDMEKTIWLIGFVCIIFFFLFVMMFYRMFSKPIKRLKSELDSYPYNRKVKTLSSVGVKELDYIIMHINKMLKIMDIKGKQSFKNQEKLYEMEIEARNSRLYMYQMQIQPHFLYNTLGCINSYAMERGAYEIVEMTTMMSEMFRYTLEKGNEVCLESELEYIHNYINIQNYRFQDSIKLQIDIDDELFSCLIPRMTLQPFVENSVKHGLKESNYKGIISIFAEVENNNLAITIRDNGKGLRHGALELLKKKLDEPEDSKMHEGIGIANVHKRLKLMYGEKYGITVDSKEYEGFCVSIVIPAVFEEDSNE